MSAFFSLGIESCLGFGIWNFPLEHDENQGPRVRRDSCHGHAPRARAFYEGVLGLKISEEMMSGKWVEYSLGNNTLAIASVGPQWLTSDQRTGAALEGEKFDEAVKWLKDRHVSFVMEAYESPCCWMAIIKDPDGNNIVIHKLKPENEKEPCV